MATATIAETIETYSDNPFHGPSPLREGDPIFGRDREIRLLRDQLLSDRLVLLHAISGCGKTSLVEAGLRPMLRTTLSEFPTINIARRKDEPPVALTLLQKVAHAIVPNLDLGQLPNASPAAILPRLVDALSSTPDTVEQAKPASAARLSFLFFDQFETVLADKEISDAERMSFLKSLGLLLEGGNVWALIAIREDYLGDLQPLLRYLPTQLRSRFRLTRLLVDAAASAIQMKQKFSDGSHVGWKVACTEAAARSLADELGQREGATDQGGIVEPVHLQVVCDYLWQTYPHPVSVEHLGADEKRQVSVTAALGEYYERIIKSLAGSDEDLEFAIRSWFENSLIDRGERRNKVRITRDSREITAGQLEFLINKYLIRDDQPSAPSADRVIELAHDRLIVPILRQNREWFRRYKQTWFKTAFLYSKNPADVLLLGGDDLKKALEWARKNPAKLELQPIYKTFLQASKTGEQRRLRFRRVTWWAAIATVAFLAIMPASFYYAGQAWIKSRAAEVQTLRAAAAIAESQGMMERANNTVKSTRDQLAALQPLVRKQQQELKNAKETLRIDHQNSLDEIAQAKRETVNAQKIMSDAVKYASDTNTLLANSKNDLSKQADAAERLRHQNNALQAISTARGKRDLNAVVVAFKEAQAAGDLALSNVAGSENLVQQAANVTGQLLSHVFIQNTLCIRGFFQSFAHFPETNVNLAMDQAGYYYPNSITADCPSSVPAPDRQLAPFPNSSSLSAGGGAYIAAVGTREGDIKVFADGRVRSYRIDMHEPIVALSLSANGAYLGASSALWSVSVWRLNEGRARRVLRWPGSVWNPASWLKWLSIVHSTTNQLTNTLAIHLDEEVASTGRKGIMAAGQDDGRVKIVPVNAEGHHSTKDLALLDCRGGNAIVALAFSPDGNLLATGTRSGIVRVWNLASDSGIWRGRNENESVVITKWNEGRDAGNEEEWCGGSVTSLEFIAGQKQMLAAGCQDAAIHIYDIDGLKFGSAGASHFEQLAKFTASPEGARILAFDPKAKLLYSTGASPYVELWRIPGRAEFDTYNQLQARLTALHQSAAASTGMSGLDREIGSIINGVCRVSVRPLEACGTP